MLASIKGLQHLQIWMVHENYGTPQFTSTQEADFFIPLLAIKGLRYFSIEVPWDPTPAAEDLLQNAAPFHLMRTDSIS